MRKRVIEPTVLGLDLSLRGTAAVVLAPHWRPGTDWAFPVLVAGGTIDEQTPRAQVERVAGIVEAVVEFAREHAPTHVACEDYAWGLAHRGGMRLAELVGAVKHALHRELDLDVVPVGIDEARKFFLGHLPTRGKGAKAIATHEGLRRAGCPVLGVWSKSDPGDALLVASYHRTSLGLPGLTLSG